MASVRDETVALRPNEKPRTLALWIVRHASRVVYWRERDIEFDFRNVKF